MDVKRRIPHEGLKNNDDGLPLDGSDTEGHVRLSDDTGGAERVRVSDDTGSGPDGVRAVPDDTEGHARLTVNPGTGGDLTPRHPSTGGEFIDENDVEGHRIFMNAEGLTVNPGTGGDFSPRHPSTGGEFIDENDVEGHVR